MRTSRSGTKKLSEEAIKDLDFVPHTPATAAGGGAGGGRGATGKALMVITDDGSAVVLDVDKAGAVLCRVELATKSEPAADGGRVCIPHVPPIMPPAGERIPLLRDS